MEIYTYSNCTSCRNAESLALQHGFAASKRDIFKQPLSADELRELFSRIGPSPSQMIATRSRPYRDLGLADRSLTDDVILALMEHHPALIRRPIVVAGSDGHVGFNRGAIEAMIERVKQSGMEGSDDA